MAYWGSKPEDSDFAFGSVGSAIYLIKERMIKDIDTVLKTYYSEQGIIASLTCLRLLGERFPKSLSVHFGKQDFSTTKNAFYQWYTAASPQLPPEYRHGILEEAEREFALFEVTFFSSTG